MRNSTIDDRLKDFHDEPTVERFLSARELIVQDDAYDPHDRVWQQLAVRFEQGHHEQIVAACPPLRQRAGLSPRFHYFWGVAAAELGQAAVADAQKRVMQDLLSCLLHLGDGSPQAPFLSTYLWDAYDILQALGVPPVGQRIVASHEGRFDVIRSEDGDDYWFDVTDLVVSGPPVPEPNASLRG